MFFIPTSPTGAEIYTNESSPPCSQEELLDSFHGCNALSDQGAAESGFCQTDVRIGGGLVAQNFFGLLVGDFRTGRVNILCPLEGGGDQLNMTIHHGDHAADASTVTLLTVLNDGGSSHATGCHQIGVSGTDADVACGSTDHQFLHLSVKFQSVRGDNL